ncbi:class A sortase [Vagococcus sp. BWB3-3]|uniref:Class A sortase n=1 Tax=Vagococcus allomyrinae TaxID=2794353 RepID=A0A940SUR6_9ENTE|nr:class A sortase [Vagococcus allomyrinae]MBP1039613.1 class A sortase [Vagococcus allomyrinae]
MNEKSQARKDRLIKGLIIILFLGGIICLVIPFAKRALLSYRIESVSVQQTLSVPTNEVSQGSVIIQPPTLSETLALYRHQPEASLGRLVIPDVAIDVPIFPTLINENLLLGAVTMFPERDPNQENLVLVSHHLWNETLLFGPLMNVQPGQAMFLSYGDQVYQYRVTEIKTVPATEISVMDNRQLGELTLITCDRPTLTDQRLVVNGTLVKEEPDEIKEKMHNAQEQGVKTISDNRLIIRHFGWLLVCVFIIMLVLTWIVIKL